MNRQRPLRAGLVLTLAAAFTNADQPFQYRFVEGKDVCYVVTIASATRRAGKEATREQLVMELSLRTEQTFPNGAAARRCSFRATSLTRSVNGRPVPAESARQAVAEMNKGLAAATVTVVQGRYGGVFYEENGPFDELMGLLAAFPLPHSALEQGDRWTAHVRPTYSPDHDAADAVAELECRLAERSEKEYVILFEGRSEFAKERDFERRSRVFTAYDCTLEGEIRLDPASGRVSAARLRLRTVRLEKDGIETVVVAQRTLEVQP
ncbi:MAG: hypothetical protein JXR37_22825 [Kiritimatiellae bacterium]|nr:hypothetical protein [Kiritimatiellia bacterium]